MIDKLKPIFYSISYNYVKPFKRYIFSLKEYYNMKKILKTIKPKKIFNKTYVLNVIRNRRGSLHLEVILGVMIALQGGKVKILLDDGVMMHWDTYKSNRFPEIFEIDNYPHNRYHLNIKYNRNILDHFLEKHITKKFFRLYKVKNLEYIYYSDILDLKKIDFKNSKGLEKDAVSSTIKFFTNSELDYNEKIVKYYYLLSLKNAILSKKVGEYVLNDLKPDFFITLHAIYSTWAPAFDFLKKKGCECIVFAGGSPHTYDPQEVIFSYVPKQILTRGKLWHNFKNTPVTEDMKKKVNEYFSQRLNLIMKDTKVFYEEISEEIKVDKNDDKKYHIALFSGVIWDGNIKERHLAFSGLIDWIVSTIEFLSERDDVKIYLRLHPSEVTTYKSSKKIQEILKDFLNSFDSNKLVVIPSEKKINTYDFIKSGIDLGIIYDGILGLELSYLKVPTLLGSVRGRFSVEGGNFTINSREDYFNKLENFEKLIEDFKNNYDKYYTNIIRYAYFYIYQCTMKYPTMPKCYGENIFNLFELTTEELKLPQKLIEILS